MKVYLDVDNVLADWTGGVHRALGIDYDYHQWPYTKGPKGWHWHDEIRYSFSQVNGICDMNFWANLRWTEDGRDILRVILDYVEPKDIVLLTTPMPHIMSASGKIAWMYKNLPTYVRQMLICPGHKADSGLPLVPDSVLIDDSSHNVRDWREAGGRAILVPRWWNECYMCAEDSVEWVRQEMAGLMLERAMEHE